MESRQVVILGSTGSVGRQAANVIREHPGEFSVFGLAAGGGDVATLARQIVEFRPSVVAVSRPAAIVEIQAAVKSYLGTGAPSTFRYPEYLAGSEAARDLAAVECDVVLNGITGAVGLPATLAALEAGRVLALANKESLIVGGDLVKRVASPGQIIPVDSEHSAIAQSLRSGRPTEVARLVVTATGGPFRGMRREDLKNVTLEQALAHPKWSMGPVITINSATMANKGLEVIEAHLLFDIPFERIEVVVHPQAYIHSMVDFVDGSTIAQVNPPDMRLPIALGLKWPDRMHDVSPSVDWSQAHTWELRPLDEALSPMVDLARQAGKAGEAAPAVYNAANEVCVEAFRVKKIPFLAIYELVAEAVEAYVPPPHELSIEDLHEYDSKARRDTTQAIKQRF